MKIEDAKKGMRVHKPWGRGAVQARIVRVDREGNAVALALDGGRIVHSAPGPLVLAE